jgi:hypothetical protein
MAGLDAVMVVKVDVRAGPTLRTALDVLELADVLIELLPDWYEDQIRELKARRQALAEIAEKTLHSNAR